MSNCINLINLFLITVILQLDWMYIHINIYKKSITEYKK